MGGLSIAAVGYEITEALESYQQQHNLSPDLYFIKQLLRHLESETSTPISLARLDDLDGSTRDFLCCYVDYREKIYDCDELRAVTIPPQFTRVKELLGIKGDLKRVFAPKGMVVSYDSNGQTRVGARGLAI